MDDTGSVKRARSTSSGDDDEGDCDSTVSTTTATPTHCYYTGTPEPVLRKSDFSRQLRPKRKVLGHPSSLDDSQAGPAALKYTSAGSSEGFNTGHPLHYPFDDTLKPPAPLVDSSLYESHTMFNAWADQDPGAGGSISTATVVGSSSHDNSSEDLQSFFGGGIPSNAGQTGTFDLSANQDDIWSELPHPILYATERSPMERPHFMDMTSRITGSQHTLSDTPWSPMNLYYSPSDVLVEQPHMSYPAVELPYINSTGQSSLLPSPALPSFQPTHVFKHEPYIPWFHKTAMQDEFMTPAPQIYPKRAGLSCGNGDLSNVFDLQDINSHDPYSIVLPLSHSRRRQRSSEPWSPINLDGSTALGSGVLSDSTGAGFEAGECSFQMPQGIVNLPDRSDPPPLQPSSTLPDSSADTPQNASAVQWEHNTLSSGSFERASAKKRSESRQKPGRRHGPLNPDNAKKASEVRKIKACWQCWLLKVPCDLNSTCSRCQNLQPSPLTTMLCIRARLHDYTELFFPPLLAHRHSESAVQDLINENISGFTDNEIEVFMSSGPNYPPISVTVHEFIPSNQDFLALYFVTPGADAQTLKTEPSFAPPLGLLDFKGNNLKDKCWEHIRSIIKQERNHGETKSGHTSPIVWKSYEAVDRFWKSSECLGNIQLLRKAMMLYAMNYFMSRIVSFTRKSATEVIPRLRRPTQFNYQQSKSSKLLNVQIKQEMYHLLRGVTRDVLEGLEKELRSRTKNSWATSFCVILILCTCVEAVQVAADCSILRTFLTKNNDSSLNKPDGATGPSRSEAIKICQLLDDLPFTQCVKLFHNIHRTSRPKSGHRNERGFNPIRDGLHLDEKEGLNRPTLELVEEMRSIIRDHEGDLDHLSRNPSLEPVPDLLADHMRFRVDNSGRLVAKFFKSFLETT